MHPGSIDSADVAEEENAECPSVSVKAQEVITALQAKPYLLREIAQHFDHGWPTALLLGPWTSTGLFGHPVLVRFIFDAEILHTLHKYHIRGGIGPFIDEGYTEGQWVGAIQLKEGGDVRRRVFDDPDEALLWVEDQLTAVGFLLPHAADKTDLGPVIQEFCDSVKAHKDAEAAKAEAKRQAEIAEDEEDEEFPF